VSASLYLDLLQIVTPFDSVHPAQVAIYNGGLPGHADSFKLDNVRVFRANDCVPVDAATAAMLKASRYSPFFEVSEASEHRGQFTKWPIFPACVRGAPFQRRCSMLRHPRKRPVVS